MFEKIFGEYAHLAITVIAGIVIIFGMYYASLNGLGGSLVDFVNSYNN